jgi:hypothetical protein
VLWEVPFDRLLDCSISSKLAKSSSRFLSMSSNLDSSADAVLSPLAPYLSEIEIVSMGCWKHTVLTALSLGMPTQVDQPR